MLLEFSVRYSACYPQSAMETCYPLFIIRYLLPWADLHLNSWLWITAKEERERPMASFFFSATRTMASFVLYLVDGPIAHLKIYTHQAWIVFVFHVVLSGRQIFYLPHYSFCLVGFCTTNVSLHTWFSLPWPPDQMGIVILEAAGFATPTPNRDNA